jgi:hypothetical protein
MSVEAKTGDRVRLDSGEVGRVVDLIPETGTPFRVVQMDATGLRHTLNPECVAEVIA